jgi:TfoX/Sxy family transcriptional regulator of competence genes
MAYDETLAQRIRTLANSTPGLSEKKMFGGLAFLVNGNMAISASGNGGVMVRVDPAQSDAITSSSNARMVEMRGREMPGWLRVDTIDVQTDEELKHWVELGTKYASSLPPK